MTPGLEFTRRRVTAGGGESEATDLSAIRRSGDALEQLAARAASGPQLRADPALVLLGALAADVDSPSRWPAGRPGGLPPRRRAGAGRPPSAGLAAWLRAAVAGALLPGLAGTTSLICATMLHRLRCAPRRGRTAAGGWAPRPARRWHSR